jgi:hypothetical protein
MAIDLYTKNTERVWAKFMLHIPTIIVTKREHCDFGDDYVRSELNFGTLIRVRTSRSFFHIKVKILGFGFEGTIQEIIW